MAATNDSTYSDISKLSPAVSRVSFDFWAQPVFQLSDGTYTCPGFTGPVTSDSKWDFVDIGFGFAYTPGICEVVVRKYRDVDKKKAKGQDGARVTIHGIEPATIEIQLTIWTPQQLRKLQELWAILFPGITKTAKGTKPKETAWDVAHPTFKTHDVKSVVFTAGDGPAPGKFPRSRMFTMHAIEYLPPGKSTATHSPVNSKANRFDPPGSPTPGSVKKNRGP